MILQDDFYKIISMQTEGNNIKALLEMNAAHKIFEGHFPKQPVVPGVCMLQIVKEITRNSVQYPLRLTKADHLKFLAVINPIENKLLNLDLQYQSSETGSVAVTASLFYNETTFFKFKGAFTRE